MSQERSNIGVGGAADTYDLGETAERLEEGRPWGDWDVPSTSQNRYFDEMSLGPVLDRMVDTGDTVLDLGCSYGWTAEDLSDRYENREVSVYGVDAADRIGDIRQPYRNGDATFVQAISPRLPFEDGSVDDIIACNSAHIVAQQLRGVEQADYVADTLDALGSVSTRDGTLLLGEADGRAYLRLDSQEEGDTWTLSEARGFTPPFGHGIRMPTSLFPWMESDRVDIESDTLSVYRVSGDEEVPVSDPDLFA